MPTRLLAQPTTALLVALVPGSLASIAPGQTAPPSATVIYSIDGGPTISVPLVGALAQNGNASFNSTLAPAGAGWELQVLASSDFTANPGGNMIGLVTFKNLGSTSRNVLLTVEMPICPVLQGGSYVGGTTTVTLNATGPGTFSCGGSPAILTFLANGSNVGSLFFCPFSLIAGGSGTLSSNAQFGLPGPNSPGPVVLETIGVRQHFTITGSDTAQVQFNYLLLDPPGIMACQADLSGDGVVSGADLSYLFTAWGTVSTCASPKSADLDGDGMVGVADLQLLLGAWGADCSES